MLHRTIVLITILGLPLIAACGVGGGANSLTLSTPDAEGVALPVSSGYVYTSTMTYSEPDGNGGTKMSKCPSYSIYLADYDLDPARGAISLGKEVDAENQHKVVISLHGEENADSKSTAKTGTYSTSAEKFMSVEWAEIRSLVDGKERRVKLEGKELKGGVKITSASDESISGEVDLTDGKKQIKGSFTATLHGAATKKS